MYGEGGGAVDFVRHLLVDVVKASMSRAEVAGRHGVDAGRPIVGLLPGSRRSEIERHYPLIMEACERLSREARARGSIQFVLAAAPSLGTELFEPYARLGIEVMRVGGATYDALRAADCAI